MCDVSISDDVNIEIGIEKLKWKTRLKYALIFILMTEEWMNEHDLESSCRH